MQDVQITLPPGSVIRDRYTVEDLLGKGGFGAVYLVRDQRVKGNLFALKEVVDPNKEERVRFAFECEVLKRLDHPALPRVYRVFQDDKTIRVYMLMDYIQGPNLEILRQRQPEKRFPLHQVMKIMAPIMSAVGYLHQQRPPIIHRDIKPANIIVPDEGDEVVLVDFGIAKEYDQDATTTAVRRCSPGYGAPEQYARGTNPRTDIYGLGATFYALLTGTVPADALYRMTQLGSKKIDPLEPVQLLAPNIPPHVADAIHRAMAINSNFRFATVDEFWQALNAQPLVEAPAPVVAPGAATQLRVDATHAAVPGTADISMMPTRVYQPRKTTPTRRRSILPLLLLLLVILVLLVGLLFGFGLLPKGLFGSTPSTSPLSTKGGAHTAPTSTVATPPKATATSSASTSTATPPTSTTPSLASTTPAAPSQQTTPPPTTVPSTSPPQLDAHYNGTATDVYPPSSSTTANVSLSLRQSGANISGFATIYYPLQGTGNFTGRVFANKTVQVTVAAYANHLPLFFTGTIQADGSIQGSYCAIDSNGHCNNSEGYGFWHVYPLQSRSSITLPDSSYVSLNPRDNNGKSN